LIRKKEDADSVELKWKAVIRQSQNEAQDLRFLVNQKDLAFQKLEGEHLKLRMKLDKVMEKLYMPSQD
jgi:hypothetical protein